MRNAAEILMRAFAKKTLFQTLVCRAGMQRFANVLFCGLGFFCLCVRKKKQNKFPQTAPTCQ
jgi:hypothetical protein